MAFKQAALQAEAPVSLRLGEATAGINAPAGHKDMQISVTLPGAWNPAKPVAGVKWERQGEAKYRLTLPADVTQVQLAKG